MTNTHQPRSWSPCLSYRRAITASAAHLATSPSSWSDRLGWTSPPWTPSGPTTLPLPSRMRYLTECSSGVTSQVGPTALIRCTRESMGSTTTTTAAVSTSATWTGTTSSCSPSLSTRRERISTKRRPGRGHPTSQGNTSRMARRACSSVGQSAALTPRRSSVRDRPGPPFAT